MILGTIRTVAPILIATPIGLGLLASPGVCEAAEPAAIIVDSGVVTPSTNAALRYWRAWIFLDESEHATLVEDGLDGFGAHGWAPSPELQRLIDDNTDLLTRLERASQIPGCDFGVEYGAGLEALMPHLGPLRLSARLLGADARVRLDKGQAEAATNRLAGAIRATEHMTHDRVLLSSLVAFRTFEPIDDLVRYGLRNEVFDAEQRRVLRDAYARFRRFDPFNIESCLMGERDISVPYLRRVLSGPEGAARLVEVTHIPSVAVLQELVDEGRLRAELEQLDAFYDSALAAWRSNDRRDALGRLDDRVNDGVFGELAKFFAPASLSNVAARDEEMTRRLDETIEMLSD
ncbi:MAG: hypothetical protein AAGI53_00310 [Planctomycetota bacterium]